MATKFKVGDRVAVYGDNQRRVGNIEKIEDDSIFVTYKWYHLKQSRLLKKKERRRVWIADKRIGDEGDIGMSFHNMEAYGWIEFVEVRKKPC